MDAAEAAMAKKSSKHRKSKPNHEKHEKTMKCAQCQKAHSKHMKHEKGFSGDVKKNIKTQGAGKRQKKDKHEKKHSKGGGMPAGSPGSMSGIGQFMPASVNGANNLAQSGSTAYRPHFNRPTPAMLKKHGKGKKKAK